MKRFAKSMFNALGFEIKRSEPSLPSSVYSRRVDYLMRCLNECNVNYLLDIGANEGQYAASFRDYGFQGNMISFEPLDGPFSILKERAENDKKWDVKNLAVGNEDNETIIHVAGNSESSSILPMLSLHIDAHPPSAYTTEQKTRLRKIDTACKHLISSSNRLAMKLDVQGYELQALEGAVDLLKQVHVVDIELSLDSLYDGQAGFVDVIKFLEMEGFTPVSFENGFTDPRNGHALQVDAVFIRKASGTALKV